MFLFFFPESGFTKRLEQDSCIIVQANSRLDVARWLLERAQMADDRVVWMITSMREVQDARVEDDAPALADYFAALTPQDLLALIDASYVDGDSSAGMRVFEKDVIPI